MKLDGWHRLWLVTCVIYLVALGVLVAPYWPNSEDISHEHVYEDLGPEFRKTIHDPKPQYSSAELYDKIKRANPKASPAEIAAKFFMGELDSSTSDKVKESLYDIVARGGAIFMPNGHVVFFSSGSSEEDRRKVAAEYQRIVRSQLFKKRGEFLFFAGLRWIIPCLLVYILGLSITWIYRGFKST